MSIPHQPGQKRQQAVGSPQDWVQVGEGRWESASELGTIFVVDRGENFAYGADGAGIKGPEASLEAAQEAAERWILGRLEKRAGITRE